MNLQALLGSAVIAALISAFGGVLTKMVVDARLNRELESLKSDLSVWAVFRNETIKQMWSAHREIVGAMTDLIFKVQELRPPAQISEASSTVEEYRRLIHKHVDLLSLEDVQICQRFLDTHMRSHRASSLRMTRIRSRQSVGNFTGRWPSSSASRR